VAILFFEAVTKCVFDFEASSNQHVGANLKLQFIIQNIERIRRFHGDRETPFVSEEALAAELVRAKRRISRARLSLQNVLH
jgi:phosphoribulokinase